MSTSTITRKRRSANLAKLDRQMAQARAILRQLRDTLEDLDDRRELAKAKRRNGSKPGTSWETVKKELGLKF